MIVRPNSSVIVPLLNEEGNVYELYRRISTVLKKTHSSYEILFVDDGSKDNTLQAIEKIASEDVNVKYISFSRNFGHQLALYAGLENCQGDHIVLIDGDLQDPPEIIEVLFEKLTEGFNIVYAKRKVRKGETFLKKQQLKYSTDYTPKNHPYQYSR